MSTNSNDAALDVLAGLVNLLADGPAAAARIKEYRDAAASAKREQRQAKADRINVDSEIADRHLEHERKLAAERAKLDQERAEHQRDVLERARNIEAREQHTAQLEAKAAQALEEASAMREISSRRFQRSPRRERA